jgi:hypothetical protein
MNMLNINDLGLEPGQKFMLRPEDFSGVSYKFARPRQIGLAIDNHIKNYLKPRGIIIPPCKFAAYDFSFKGSIYDIKSYSSRSVTMSVSEKRLADIELSNGRDVTYVIFEQLQDMDFQFRCYVSYKDLSMHAKIKTSKFGETFYFFLEN